MFEAMGKRTKTTWTSETAPRSKGRPMSGKSRPDRIRAMADEPVLVTDEEGRIVYDENGQIMHKTREQLFIEKLFADAMEGQPTAMKLIFQHLYGLPKQQVEHSGHILNTFNDIIKYAAESIDSDGDSGPVQE